MNVLSLFDGISCGQQALKNMGLKTSLYRACEIDKYAQAITSFNFPKTEHYGDVKTFKSDDTKFDLMLAGFPCQAFSKAGKKGGFEDSRGGLFFDMIRIRNKVKPKFFLFENVKMKKEFLDVINAEIGVEPQEINSALVSAQSRKRLYWVGHLQQDGTYKKVEIPQPEDLGIILSDILQPDTDFKDDVFGKMGNYLYAGRKKVFSKEGLCRVGTANLKGHDSIKRVYAREGKSPTLTTMGGGHREPKIESGRLVNLRLDSTGTRKDYDRSIPRKETLTKRTDNKSGTLTIKNKNNVLIKDDYLYRKLTPLECERLQSMPDNFTQYGKFTMDLNKQEDTNIKLISNSQRYKAVGNAWTIKVIEHILRNLIIKE